MLDDRSLLRGFGIEGSGSRRDVAEHHDVYKAKYMRWYGAGINHKRLERLESLESLESLQSLQRLQSLERLQISQKDYRELNIPDNATIYCDPPYQATQGYGMEFDHEAFWQWCREQAQPVFVSEYTAPDDFVCVWDKERTSLISPNSRAKVVEKLFVHERFKPYKPKQRTLFEL